MWDMPKLVDYAARFEFLREAAFAVVLEDGPAALSRHSLADALGTSASTIRRLLSPNASLPGLAAAAVERRRRHGRWGMPRSGDRPEENALRLIESIIPDSDERLDEETVWLKLVLHQPGVQPLDAKRDLRERYAVYEHGWSEPTEELSETRDDPALARAIAQRETYVRIQLLRLAQELDVPEVDRPRFLRRVRTHLDGITFGLCLGHLTREEAREQVGDLVRTVSRLTW